MNKYPFIRPLLIIIAVLLMAACSPPSTPTAEQPALTPSIPTVTHTNQPRPTNTSTATLQASHTPPPLPSATPTITLTPTPAPPEVPIFGHDFRSTANTGVLNAVLQTRAPWWRGPTVAWGGVERSPGERTWSVLNAFSADIQLGTENGLIPIVIVRFTPPWAQQFPGVFCGPVQAEQLSAFVAFMGDLVARYSQPPYQIKYWEIWNEPDIAVGEVHPESGFGCWGDQNDPFYGGGLYAEMLKLVYPAVKAADPEAQVLVGGLLMNCDPVNPPEGLDCTPSKYLEGILESGGGDYFDGVSFHAYDFYANEVGKFGNLNWHSTWNTTGPVLIAKTQYLRNLLIDYGLPEKYLLNTELALLCGSTGKEAICQTEAFQDTKAYYLAQSNAASLAEGLRSALWFRLQGWRGSELVTGDLQPLPAFQAYQFSTQQLAEAAYLGEIEDYPAVKGYKFFRNGDFLWLLWSLDGEPHNVQLPSGVKEMYDVFGEPLPVEQKLEITLAPVYIVFES